MVSGTACRLGRYHAPGFNVCPGAQSEPAVIREKYRAAVPDLPLLVFPDKGPSRSHVQGSERSAHYRTWGPQVPF